MSPDLSVIIPAYNESKSIESTLLSIIDHFREHALSVEVIVVDDGSRDETADIVRKLAHNTDNLRLIQLKTNTGKGGAVKIGMRNALGKYKLYMDADSSTHISEIDKFLPYISNEFDIVVGSRRIAHSEIVTMQPFHREMLGNIFRHTVYFLFKLDVFDTQAGFKVFKSEHADLLFKDLQTTGWCFDVEILVRAKQRGYSVKEIPIVWDNDPDTKMRFPHMLTMLIDLSKIKFFHDPK